jgi:hypothetical protein
MITDIPTGDDFRQAAADLLNLAWDNAITLLIERVDTAENFRLSDEVADIIREGDDEYWQAAMPILSSSLSLIQQAIEFFLKGKIVDISPFLLITDRPQNWPSNCSTQDISFASFRTLDAQDLPRVHDTVAAIRLPENFFKWYEDMRIRRNRIMHSVHRSLDLRDLDIIQAVLETSEMFLGSQVWVNCRWVYLTERTPSGHNEKFIPDLVLAGEKVNQPLSYSLNQLQSEIMTVIEIMRPALVRRFFGFPKKQRRYLCLHCLSVRQKEYFFEYKNKEEFYLNTAVLVDQNPTCDRVNCVICGGTYRVIRQACNEEGCPSNVIDAHNGLCLIHDNYIEEGVSIQPPI